MFRVYVDPYRQSAETKRTSIVVETHRVFKVDFSKAADVRGTTVSSVAWSSEGSRQLTVSSESLSSGVAQASVYAENSGWAVLKVKATYASGEVETQYINILVQDPEYNLNTIS